MKKNKDRPQKYARSRDRKNIDRIIKKEKKKQKQYMEKKPTIKR